MHPDLETLVDLHHADVELRRFDAELVALPQKKEAIEAHIVSDRAALDGAKAAMDGLSKDRKRLELEVQDFEAKRSKYKGQLGEVKTNKEYTALLHEIENVEREIRSREDLILEAMEKVEGGQAKVKAEEAAFKSVEATRRDEIKAIEGRIKECQAQRAEVAVTREKKTAALKPDLFAEYTRILQRRGVALAEAKDGACTMCHVKLRAQVFVDVKRNDAIITCSSCSRILFFDAPPPQGALEAPLPS
ncbi:MAG: C4-type zinc ribbon domain-containing protein [Vicinamibacteria bacterium]